MNKLCSSEALRVLSSTVDVTHDSLSSFTDDLQSLDRLPSLWWREFPVWIAEHSETNPHNWPLISANDDVITFARLEGGEAFEIPRGALRHLLDALPPKPLTDAEFTLFVDLSCGRTLEDSAAIASLAKATRRKQLQSLFAKLSINSQAELVSFANNQIQLLRRALNTHLDGAGGHWDAYAKFLPEGIRFGVINGKDHAPVRYLDVGPVGGKPVLILHPMVFPDISPADIKLFHQLGWRTIWPIRAGCLSTQNDKAGDWHDHCAQTVLEIRAVKNMVTDQPVPIIALVSSAAYAIEFAQKFPKNVSRVDFISTCFSAGSRKSSDAFFGDFLTKNLMHNGRLALLAIRHMVSGIRETRSCEKTMRRVFGESRPDQSLLNEDFKSGPRSERIMFAILNSIDSMRNDYFAQIHFSWQTAKANPVPKYFWHGAEDKVHDQQDLCRLAERVTGAPSTVIPEMGHLTQGAPLRAALSQIAGSYPK